MDIFEQIAEFRKIYPPVDLNSLPGTKVVFTGENGYDSERARANEILTVGETYTLARSDVGGWSSSFFLEEHPDIAFNSVHFCPEGWAPPPEVE